MSKESDRAAAAVLKMWASRASQNGRDDEALRFANAARRADSNELRDGTPPPAPPRDLKKPEPW